MAGIARVSDWPAQLHIVSTAALRKPYRWGDHDCCLFAADCVLAMTGVDLAEDFRGAYHDEATASDMLERLNCESVADLPGIWFEEISVSQARRGDVALFDGEFGPFLAICDGITAVGPAARGIAHVQIVDALRAWRI